MKLKTIGAAALAAAVMGAASATASAGTLPGGDIQAPMPDDPSASGADTPNDVAPAPGINNPATGAQGVAMVIGAAVLAGAAVVVSRKKR